MSSVVLESYVVIIIEFASILILHPCDFAFTSLEFVQEAYFPSLFLWVPIFGYDGDLLTRTLTKRCSGMSEPQYRLIPMLLPTIVL
jgi:hypothetical protein